LNFKGSILVHIAASRNSGKFPEPAAWLAVVAGATWEESMAIEPNTPYDPDRLNDPTRTTTNDRRSPADMDQDLEGIEPAATPTSNGRIALLAVGIAVVLGGVFYGLNNSSMQRQATTAPTPANSQSQDAASTALPAAPPGMRDVTPHANGQPGTTTGTAPASK
jgi:hypothetical protein